MLPPINTFHCQERRMKNDTQRRTVNLQQKKIKLAALTVIELPLSEGISRSDENSVKLKRLVWSY